MTKTSSNKKPIVEKCLRIYCGLDPSDVSSFEIAARNVRRWALQQAMFMVGGRHGRRGFDADDVVQEAFLHLSPRSLRRFNPGRGSLQSYCYQRIRWANATLCREISRRQACESLERDEQARGPSPCREAHRRQVRRELFARFKPVLRRLNRLDRRLIVMRYLREASTEQIRAATGLTANQINNRMHAIRRNLRELLEPVWRFYRRNRFDLD